MCSATLRLVLCVALIVAVSLSNGQTRRRHGAKRSRFLSFNTLDGDVSVDLEFSIPFITIPVKKTMEGAFGSTEFSLPTVNINMAALVIGGVVVTFTVLFLPVLLKSYARTGTAPNSQYRRLLDHTEFGADAVFDFANQLLMDSRTFQGCALKVACWTAKSPNHEDVLKLLGHINSNQILSSMLNATAIEDAVSSGHLGRDCGSYGPCSIRDEHMPVLFNSLGAFGKQRN